MRGCHRGPAPLGVSGWCGNRHRPGRAGPRLLDDCQAAMSLALVRDHCPACGYPGLASPAYARLGPPPWFHPGPPPTSAGTATRLICPCCGFEPATTMIRGQGPCGPCVFEQYLREWVRSGGNWLDESLKPEGWELAEQLRAEGIMFSTEMHKIPESAGWRESRQAWPVAARGFLSSCASMARNSSLRRSASLHASTARCSSVRSRRILTKPRALPASSTSRAASRRPGSGFRLYAGAIACYLPDPGRSLARILSRGRLSCGLPV